MRIRKLLLRHLVLSLTLFSATVLASEATEPSGKGLPILLTVGADGACLYSSLQAALNVTLANGPGEDFIWIAMNYNETSVSAEIFAQSVTIVGGYSSCSAFSSTGRTTIDGSGGSLGSVFDIHGGSPGDQHVVTLRNLTIRGGEDDGFGGGLDIRDGMRVSLENTVVEDNESTYGGGISVRGIAGASLLIAEFSQILSNTATQDGGGVYCEAGFADLFDSAIAYNEANRGGGIAVEGCYFRQEAGGTLRGIFLNTALSQGGGIHAQGGSTVELTGNSTAPASVVSNNALSTGGGIWVTSSEVRAKNAAIDSNVAQIAGGGVGVGAGGRLFMERLPGGECHTADRCSTLSGNVADGGGGFWATLSGIADIRQTYIEGNTATGEGSAALVIESARVAMEGVVLAGNQGGTSVVKVDSDASGILTFVTMTDNSASDAAIVARDDLFGHANSLEIYSSILFEPDILDLLSFDTSTSVAVDCLLVNDNQGLPPGAFITVLSPIFVDAAGGDYHLQPTSPAVDYCDTAAYQPTHRDIDHQERGNDDPQVPDNFLISWFDIGADELALPGLIFSDGFESGETTAWSSTFP